MATNKNNKSLNQAEALFGKLMGLIGLKSEFEILEDKDNNTITINIKGEDESGLIIGSRGKTLSSLQTVMGLIIKKATGEWTRVVVNVSDYREKEEGRLNDLADQTAERALSSGEVQNLYNLTPAQRRVVHMRLSENKKVKTESQGEGGERYLTITPLN